ncbi:hypothetical protein PHYSODRAFT_337908 [Phytophthora sojae]|uniref:ubiquitinyl hydrolase 1 n=1 Tax=Phytophthora sojae (strain P6497) TaxID=1094619 RepID=G4ZZE0_PHYSP|nr:hypothetical protein PHYSODRAFT_337908 [Phytophthora sojae]EGZ11162.1 hypothetical protein PHYSODRAFT_337908 [Phytophthora sojae]|eukprot:XP_009533907.1 hypothetical protein PHYSODRAFT_337908 [Phytophthora sojae]
MKIELPRFKLTFSANDNAQFESEEHKGYVLSTRQQLDDFLPRFSQYLVLELKDISDTSRAVYRILLPVGPVEEKGMVVISTSTQADTHVDVACYDIHRRLKTFETETISARLQLAAVCTRAGTNVPSKRLQMTGAEAALSYREPAVRILAVTLLREADRLDFVFGQTEVLDTAMGGTDEQTEYRDMCAKRAQRNPLRSQFRIPIADDYVKAIETELQLCLQIEATTAKEIPRLPLDSSTAKELCWTNYKDVSSRRTEVEAHLWHVFATATSSMREQLLALANFVPVLTICVLEDKVERVIWKAKRGGELSDAQLIEELVNVRQWESSEFPQIDLNARRLEFIRDVLDELKLSGGIQIVAPEHRMSLELKRLEIGTTNPIVKTLDAILESDQFVDVLDECDALLHHKYHLVYAVGTPIPLCSGVERWMGAEALLRVLVDKSPSSRVNKVLQAPHVSCSSPDYMSRFGAFEGTRLNTVVESTEPLRDELKKALVLDLIDNAPFELMWLKTFGSAGARDSLVLAITDSTSSLEDALGDSMGKLSPYTTQLLALRGLVAFGVFEHCLEKRYRANFGLPSPGTRPKKIAIPFRAADVPSERSEFSHPDVCIVLTLLGYYHGGTSVKSRLNVEEQKALCDVHHVSLADARQFETLCRVYKFCMGAINFYLNTCVFPKTPSMAQREPNETSLLGTNGKMIDKILQVTHSYEVRPSPQRATLPWQSVLRFATDKGAQALIDTGALLAGVMNNDAAEFLLRLADFRFAGVTYYDSREEHNCWMIAYKARQIQVPLKKASMLERETFVIFDEARSRGSDMKLLPDAAAVLTLGPKLTKDKFMQGAGRMRQLGCNQTLWVVSFDEVAQSILQTCGQRALSRVSAVDVLNWIMDNTKTEAIRGLLEWAGNGIHFRKTQLDAGKELVDENWSLEELYQGDLHADKIAQVIKLKAHSDFKDSIDELCERELQVEEEVQQEREVQVMICTAAREKAWPYRKILRAQSVEDLNGVVQVFGTENFFATVTARKGLDRMNEFLRVIDVVLIFKNGQALLVSECEADHILELLWAKRGDSRACSFSFHTKIRAAHLALGSCLGLELPLLPIIACQVYNGETSLAKHQQDVVEPAFREFLRPLAQREAALSNFVKSRGNSHKWTRSFLHELCCRMDLDECK